MTSELHLLRIVTSYLKGLRVSWALALLLLSILVLSQAAYAATIRPHSTELTITGFDNQQIASREILSARTAKQREAITPISIVGTVYGLGRVDVQLTVKRNLLASSNGTFLQGTVAIGGGLKRAGSSRVVPAAASIVGDALTINFLGRAKRSRGKSRLVAIRGTLSGSNTIQARVSNPPASSSTHSTCHTDDQDTGAMSGLEADPVTRTIRSTDDGVETYKIITISTDADELWYARYGDNSNLEIARIINAAEALYFSAIGLGFSINTQHVYTQSSPYSSTNAGGLLNQFVTNPANADNLAPTRQQYFSDIDAKHLFTGKDLDGSAVGIAYIGTMCSYSSLSFGLSQATPNDTTIAVFAHEVSHTLGATHDPNSPNTLMYPSLGFGLPSGYSARSSGEIAAYLTTRSSCLGEGEKRPPSEPSATPTPQPTTPPQTTPNDGSDSSDNGQDELQLKIGGKRLSGGRGGVLVRGVLLDSLSLPVEGVGVDLYQKGRLIDSAETSSDGIVEFTVSDKQIPRVGSIFQLQTADGTTISKFLRVPAKRGSSQRR